MATLWASHMQLTGIWEWRAREEVVRGYNKSYTQPDTSVNTLSYIWSERVFLKLFTHLVDITTAMIKKMSPSENEFDIPAKNCYRMVILGSTKVGKSAIVSRFLTGRFDDQYTPTIEDFHRKLYSIRGDVYQLDILDTSGNHPFPAMRRLSILTGKYSNPVYSCSLQYGCVTDYSFMCTRLRLTDLKALC